MAGKRRILERNRVTGLLITVPSIAAEVFLGTLAYRDHMFWAYILCMFVLGPCFVGLGMLIMGPHFDEAGGETKGDGGIGLGGL
ncbi:hypothetical protein ACIP4Y_37330 [Streptomyces sp. NPDC088810]|uniref:hypothetical protein n=1 Tax=Streptomyces sp. NPDC088810 TaxID=3365904 RepID=UPI00382B1A63